MLALASVFSWAVIIVKARELSAAESDTQEFLQAYRERPLSAVYDVARQRAKSPLSQVFQAGYTELAQLQRRKARPDRLGRDQLETLLKRLSWVQMDQATRLERGLAFLATTGSSAPFVGLFGTVVGIMNAFQKIGATGSASLATVAPGIAEALVATAVGLFAAIPAVIAYNYSNARIGRILGHLDAFVIEYEAELRRSAPSAA